MRSSRLQNVAAGLGSRMWVGRSVSSCSSRLDFWRKTMLLMVLTGELACEATEARSVLLAREDADDDVDSDRRNEVRRLCGEKRAVMLWKREVCMVTVGDVDTVEKGFCDEGEDMLHKISCVAEGASRKGGGRNVRGTAWGIIEAKSVGQRISLGEPVRRERGTDGVKDSWCVFLVFPKRRDDLRLAIDLKGRSMPVMVWGWSSSVLVSDSPRA